jgi:hypothetical protein
MVMSTRAEHMAGSAPALLLKSTTAILAKSWPWATPTVNRAAMIQKTGFQACIFMGISFLFVFPSYPLASI